MIRERFLLEWARQFPWRRSEQVEQDLLISRTVVAIYSDPYLAERLAWRGGTALYKLYLTPQPRYSEDIDLVLIRPEPMGPILDRLREVTSFVPDKQAKGKRFSHILKLRFVSEAGAIPCRIKVEINCNEHFTELGFAKVPFEVSNSWFSGACEVTAYKLEEMLGTKFNAVFGRKKTRDLFDMDYVFKHSSPDVETILRCWRRYKKELGEDLPSWREFVQNVEVKLMDQEYRHGMDTLLRPEVAFDPDTAWQLMQERIVNRLMTANDIVELRQKTKSIPRSGE